MLEGTKINSPSQMASVFDIAKDTLLFLLLSCYYILESLFWTMVPSIVRPMKSLKGEIVLVTGGGGGVGRQLAIKLARLGAKVVVWDICNESKKITVCIITSVLLIILISSLDLHKRITRSELRSYYLITLLSVTRLVR